MNAVLDRTGLPRTRPTGRPSSRVGPGRVGSIHAADRPAATVPEAATGAARRERSAVPGTEQAAETAGNTPATSTELVDVRSDP